MANTQLFVRYISATSSFLNELWANAQNLRHTDNYRVYSEYAHVNFNTKEFYQMYKTICLSVDINNNDKSVHDQYFDMLIYVYVNEP